MIEEHDEPWTRKHDLPSAPLFPTVPVVAYPQTLADLVALLENPDGSRRFRAAGSHWSLSPAAESDHTFIETHDPYERHPAMGRTLTEVVPGCLSDAQVQALLDTPRFEEHSLVHIEAGKRIYQAYAELDQVDPLDDPSTLGGFLAERGHRGYAGPWAFSTLGGAGGQTVVGAFSTGTHGGDFRYGQPPVADSVQAIHLVVDGGRQYWIEPETSAWGVPLTDDDRLRAVYGDGLDIRRSDRLFDATLVSVGRFGVVYSVVLRVERQYALREVRVLRRWEGIKHEIADASSALYEAPDAGHRFLGIAVSLTPYGTGDHLAGVTRRYRMPAEDVPGRAERVGVPGPFDPLLGAPRFSMAGIAHEFGEDDDPLVFLCKHRSVIDGLLDAALGELDDLVTSNGAVTGAVVATVAVAGGGGILLLLAALAALLHLARAALDALGEDTRVGEVFDTLRKVLLGLPDPISRAAGVFAWRVIAYAVFSGKQGDLDITALSYAIMDRHDYQNVSCDVNVDSIEVFFDADGDELVAFVDALLAYEAAQEYSGLVAVGYAAIRLTGPTRALIGPQQWQRTAVVEVACLKDVEGSQQLVDHAAALALDPNYRAVLHWGQRHDADAATIRRMFGRADPADPGATVLDSWREVLAEFTEGGGRRGFSSEFSRRTGLEV